MRALIAVTALAAMLGGATLANAESSFEAAETGHAIAGTVKSYDAQDGKIVLENGQTIMLPSQYSGPAVKAGQKLSITYNDQAGEKMADTVTVLN